MFLRAVWAVLPKSSEIRRAVTHVVSGVACGSSPRAVTARGPLLSNCTRAPLVKPLVDKRDVIGQTGHEGVGDDAPLSPAVPSALLVDHLSSRDGRGPVVTRVKVSVVINPCLLVHVSADEHQNIKKKISARSACCVRE